MALPQRKLHRLKSWDYTQNGYYYITICTQNKRKLLCDIKQDGCDCEVTLTKIGHIVNDCWKKMQQVSPYIKLDYYCLMPNHLHGIIIIDAPEQAKVPGISELVRGFKSVSTRQYNKLVSCQSHNTLWQLSYYDEIIRNEEMLHDIRRYIIGNPSKWLTDDLYIK